MSGRERQTVRHVQSPDARARPEIEDALRVLDGRKVQFVVEQHQKHVVRYVELVVLHFIVRAPVLAFPELMVASPIFIAVFPDGGGDRRCVAQVVCISVRGIVFIKVRFL